MKRIQRFIFGAELTAWQKVMALLYPLSCCLIFIAVNFYSKSLEHGYMAMLLTVMYFIFLLAVIFSLYCIPLLAICYRWANRTGHWCIYYLLPWVLPIVFVLDFILQNETDASLLISKGADTETVEILWGGCGKDKRDASCKIDTVQDADLSTFKAEGKLLAKDKGECYVAGIPVGSTDPQSFKLFTEFVRREGSNFVWGIDRDSIYFIDNFMFSDYSIKKFKTSDYKRFHPLKECWYFAVDDCHVYAGDSILDMADVETFHVIDAFYCIAQDKYRVYIGQHPTVLKEYNPDNWQHNGCYLDGMTLYNRNLDPVSVESDSVASPKQN